MNLTLHLSPETEATLREQACRTGKTLEELALEALHEKLSDQSAAVIALSPDDWLRQFDAWVNTHSSRNPQLDDSRESIYPDR